MLNTPHQGPLTYLDEVAALLVTIPYPHSRPSRPRDADYTLTTALIEVESWLQAGPGNKQAPGDRRSFTADVAGALSRPGPALTRRLTAAETLVTALCTVAETGEPADREPVGRSLGALKEQLCTPDAALDAFEDLLDASRDQATSHVVIETRLSVFTETLELTDRTAAEIGRILGGILDDQALEISIARHGLDGTPILDDDPPDAFAGLTEEHRLALADRYLRRPARSGHHVVWVAYDNARIAGDSWRRQVGPCEFFDGPTLAEAHKDPDSAPPVGALPGELSTPGELAGRRDIDLWVSPDRHRRWVAVRVDLGPTQLSNPIEVGRAQVDAVVQLAVFEDEKSTWVPLAGVLHLVDGRHHTSEQFHTQDEIQHRVRVDNDSTADGLAAIASSIGAHLPVSDPALRRLLREISTVNASTKTGQLTGLIDDVRVIEFVTGQNQQPPSGWPEFLHANLSTWYARPHIFDEIWQAVWDVLNTFVFPDAPDLTTHVILEPMPDGQSLFKRKAALDLVPQLLPRLPAHHHGSRRLRELARRLQDPGHLAAWVDGLAADNKVRIDRAERVRNGLAHGGAAPAEVVATVRLLVHRHARVVARTALEAVIAGQPVKPAFDAYRRQNRTWRQRIPTAADVCDALFDPPRDDNPNEGAR